MIKILTNSWHELHLPMIGLGAVVIIICLLMGFADHYKNNQHLLLNHAKTANNNARQALQLSKQEQQDIVQYLPQYQHLLQAGFIGEEHRNQWVARLHQVSRQHQLFNVDYEIGQQAIYHPKWMFNLGHYQMHRSVMTLQWALLHEGDFINLLTDLREESSPFMVRDCEIVLAPHTEINTKIVQKNLTASCEIDWLTIQDTALKASF